MAIQIILNTEGLFKDLEKCFEDDDVKLFFYNEFYRHMEPYVPADTLAMFDTAEISADGIRFTALYSSMPYFGKTRDGKDMHYTKDKHSLATDHWDQAAWAAKKSYIVDAMSKYIGRKLNNG